MHKIQYFHVKYYAMLYISRVFTVSSVQPIFLKQDVKLLKKCLPICYALFNTVCVKKKFVNN